MTQNTEQDLNSVLTQMQQMMNRMQNGQQQATQQQGPIMQAQMHDPFAQQPQVIAGANPSGWSVPIEIEIPGQMGVMTVSVYLAFPGESFPMHQQIIGNLIQRGFRLRAFPARQPGGGFGNSNGYGQQGGGYYSGNGYGNRFGGNRYGGYRR